MKNLFAVLLFILLAGQVNSQIGVSSATITITGTALDNLHTAPVTFVIPGTGKGVRLVKPPIMKTYHDGAVLVFASNENVRIKNATSDMTEDYLSLFGDPFVTTEGISSGYFYASYACLYNGQTIYTPLPITTNGAVKVDASAPITGGGPNAKLVITIWYEEITY